MTVERPDITTEDPDLVAFDNETDVTETLPTSGNPKRVLVIKLSAFGDFILSIRSFQAIRAHHPNADITLLTTKPYVALAKTSGCFNSVLTDSKPKIYEIPSILKLRKTLRSHKFDRVYDLQRNERTGFYYKLFPATKPEWVGNVRGCSHYYEKPTEGIFHISVREKAQLAVAGITNIRLPDLSFIKADVEDLALPRSYALLVPGGAPHRPEKRWPVERYSELADHMTHLGITPVIIGTKAERTECDQIKTTCSAAVNLCGKTSLEQIAVIARKAQFSVGNDTGPMHLISAAGCPVIVLFSNASDPNKISPIGPDVEIIQVDDLQDLELEKVAAVLPASKMR
ncbi:glycosyltransferase family 9 protein [Kiloniella spongiae]|uniref:glycosyltransferase family 9 protein n=1 Tax=Kiloniella spongiae TaxID=1489064 RepID=UPI00069AEDA0|nr:glycosyltransferase family 9 protein [Kiloniella spongiae]